MDSNTGSHWKTVSTHYIRETLHNAIRSNQLCSHYQPTLLIAASEDALTLARVLRDELKAVPGCGNPLILTRDLRLYDDSNPYNPHLKAWQQTWSGQRALIVDKVDSTSATLSGLFNELSALTEAQKAEAGADGHWQDAQIGVFVLHNKRREKTVDLKELLPGRYFVGEDVADGNVQIAYPFNMHDGQPTAHGEHASGAMPRRPSLEGLVRRPSPPPPPLQHGATAIRSVSSHYVEQLLEKAVEEQQLMTRFSPTLLVAASDGALAPARFLRNYLRHRQHLALHPGPDQAPINGTASAAPAVNGLNGVHHQHRSSEELPVLMKDLRLYDDEDNPYLTAFKGSTKTWGPASLAGHNVLVVDKADSTRLQLSHFIADLQAKVSAARAEVEAAGGSWAGDPVLGVFVLHNKTISKAAELPPDILNGRYFCCEEIGNMQVAYPFNT